MTAQLALFAAAAPTRERTGQEIRDAVLARLAANAVEWLALMRAEAERLGELHGPRQPGGVTADDLRPYAERLRRERGLVPRSPNAAGAIFRGPQWEHVGWIKSTKPGHHATDLRVWRLRS